MHMHERKNQRWMKKKIPGIKNLLHMHMHNAPVYACKTGFYFPVFYPDADVIVRDEYPRNASLMGV